MDYIALGNTIRKYRRTLGLTQEKLAERCGCCTSHIGQVERAETTPSLDLTVQIANALGVSVDTLVNDSYEHPEYVYLKEISQRIDTYSVEKRIRACESILSYLDALEKFSAAK